MSAIPFSIIIPARLSSSRLPNKALADIHGKPMVVRVAERAQQSTASRIIVATDYADIQAACTVHGITSVLTSSAHQSGSTRLAEAVQILGLPEHEIVVNVQGDEPMIPAALIDRVAHKLAASDAPMATAAHPVHDFAEFQNPNCVKVVLSQAQNALYFSRAPIAYPRDIMQAGDFRLPQPAPLRHIGIYAYRAGFLQQYAAMSVSPLETTESLEQLRVLWHGYPIAVEVLTEAPPAGVDTQEDLDRVRREWTA
ncbi:3-deoxy-manno-octulosonate cytidylyltransferase [Kingella sp. (in: b-proteobacteria)]|uniref:3-deoxy-manno-octulosonate cytidylyltransferase n=1 Tax=Kingella sp. (in: b-proteobacteria) TaxID=2020713 RepID=UPI0026DD47A3|nr:3-deoxy-manno-octulosonate cytidylyltransferase [Kingella sp. (in: b-proteobacteria)]MDO4658587.1 3-deoxy-manno-octulosonate cytidylyltransferase [Kingella sp. (in: b-proteobacteria)]